MKRMIPVRIKRRVIVGQQLSNQETYDKEGVKEGGTFNFEVKPKLPLPTPGFTGFGRELGPIALGCNHEMGDSSADAGFNAGDYVQMLRTPYDSKNNAEIRYRNRIRNRATGIVAKCVDCAGTRKNVTECAAVDCPLWGFRLGSNPFRRRK